MKRKKGNFQTYRSRNKAADAEDEEMYPSEYFYGF